MNHHMLNIFLVDENYFHLQKLKHILEKMVQPEITTFEDELECLQHLDLNPDLIFLDHNLSTFSGYAIIRKIKLLNPKVQVVIVSAQEDFRIVADSLKFGAMDYIKKNGDLEIQVRRVLKNISALKRVPDIPKQAPSIVKKILRFF